MSRGQTLFRALTLLLFLSSATLLHAQLNRGVMEGLVTDPQGAVMPGADITVTALDTNVTVSTKTNSAGYYRVVNLVPGKYRARFVAVGFSPLEITDIDIPAGQVIREDAQLKVGTTRTEVKVTAEAALIQTAASNFSTDVQTRLIQDMPLQGRDLQQLVFLLPGVNPTNGPPGSNFGFNSQDGTFPDPTHAFGSDVSVNGGTPGANAWYLDGNLNLSNIGQNIAVNPSPDAVSEFQAITNAFAAEYSSTEGGVFNVVLKSGANRVHGNVYEFVRNDATNARNPFTSIDALGQVIKDRQLRYNNFGGTLGGPVVLPHLYNGKNKTFFFFSWDTSILHLLGNQVFTVPTAAMRTGDFSEDPDAVSNGIWNPYSTVGPDANGLFERTAFGIPAAGDPDGCLASHVEASGGTSCNFATQIPATISTPNGTRPGLDPVAMFFMNTFPLPNYNDPLSSCPMANTGTYRVCDNYLGAVGSSQDPNNISLKIDHRWSDKSSFFGEWLFNPGKYNNYRTPWTGPTTPFDSVGWGSVYPVSFANQIIALGHTYVFSPTLVNEFRASFSRQFLSTNPSAPYPDSVTGWPAVKQELAPLQIPVDSFFQVPNWSMSTPGGGSLSFGPTGWLNMIQTAEAYTILDNVTKIIGKHTLKTGFVYRLDHNAYDSGFPTGFYFSGGFVQDPNTGLGANGLEQFMMGGVEANGTNSYAGIMWQPYSRFRYYGFYAQDDFHIAPRFTLNLGLRYDIFGFLKTRQEPLSNFCLGCDNPVTGLKGKMIYVGDPEWPGHGQDLYPPHYNDIAPRVNFSWAPFANRKTIVRGGYDIFYSNAFEGINQPGQSAANAPGWNQEYDWTGSFYPDQCQPFSGQCVAFPLNDTSVDKRTLNGEPTTHPAQNRDSLIGIGLIQLFPPVSHDPMVQSWNLQVQHEFPGNMQLTVGYIGNHGTHLYGRHFPYNYVHTADLLKYQTSINADVPITQVYSGKTADALQQVYGTTTLPRYVLLQQYPFYGATAPSMQSFYSFMGTSVYDALNVSLQKRTSHGLDFLIAYTNSKQITNPLTDSMAGNLVDPIHYGKSGNIGGRAGTLRLYSRFQNPDNFRVDRAVAPNDIPQILNLSASYALPFGTGKAFLNQKGIVNGVLGGWRLSGNFNAESGTPLAIDGPCDELQNAIGNFGTGMCSPDLIGNPKFSGSRSRTQQIADWINPAAFQPSFGGDQNFWANYDPNDPRAWQFGTAGPLFPQIRAPGFWNLDTGLFKDFHLREDKYFEFRWEAFNALNHQNLGLPHEGFCLSPLPDGSTDKVHRSGCSFGRITNIQTDPRSMQFSLKFFW